MYCNLFQSIVIIWKHTLDSKIHRNKILKIEIVGVAPNLSIELYRNNVQKI